MHGLRPYEEVLSHANDTAPVAIFADSVCSCCTAHVSATSTCACACNLRRKQTGVGYDLLSMLKHICGHGAMSPRAQGQHYPCLLQRYRDLLFGHRM